MRNLQAKFTGFVKKHKTLSIVLVLVIALCAWWAYASFMPHPLGNKLEYLGKEDYGNILGFDYQPYSEYYYGTDMSKDEVEEYFKGVEVDDSSQQTSGATIISFTHDQKKFDLYYYWDKKEVSFTTGKKAIISIVDEDYKLAKEALK